MDSLKILLVDDDKEIKHIVKRSLNPLVKLDYVSDYEQAGKLLKLNKYNLVLLDLFIGEENSLDMTEFSHFSSHLELQNTIVITSDQNIENEIRGHDLGFRDFLKKPFNTKLLRSILDKHLAALLKSPNKTLHHSPFFLNLLKHEAYLIKGEEKKVLELTQKEFQILKFFIERKGQVLSREAIFEKLWAEESDSLPRTVDMHISSLRKKIAPFSDFIKNKRSVGYFFDPI